MQPKLYKLAKDGLYTLAALGQESLNLRMKGAYFLISLAVIIPFMSGCSQFSGAGSSQYSLSNAIRKLNSSYKSEQEQKQDQERTLRVEQEGETQKLKWIIDNASTRSDKRYDAIAEYNKLLIEQGKEKSLYETREDHAKKVQSTWYDSLGNIAPYPTYAYASNLEQAYRKWEVEHTQDPTIHNLPKAERDVLKAKRADEEGRIKAEREKNEASLKPMKRCINLYNIYLSAFQFRRDRLSPQDVLMATNTGFRDDSISQSQRKQIINSVYFGEDRFFTQISNDFVERCMGRIKPMRPL